MQGGQIEAVLKRSHSVDPLRGDVNKNNFLRVVETKDRLLKTRHMSESKSRLLFQEVRQEREGERDKEGAQEERGLRKAF